jgi:hypothetical protein
MIVMYNTAAATALVGIVSFGSFAVANAIAIEGIKQIKRIKTQPNKQGNKIGF